MVFRSVVGWRWVLMLALGTPLTACAPQKRATFEGYKVVLNTWLNADINRLIDAWGTPTSSVDLPNGNRVYRYNESRVETSSGSARSYNIGDTTYTTYTSPTTTVYHCETEFEVNAEQKIVHWRASGNSCHARAPAFFGARVRTNDDGNLEIEEVIGDTTAELYGFLAGDVILSVDSVPIAKTEEFVAAMRAHRAGDKVRVVFVRDGGRYSMAVRLSTNPEYR